MNAKLPPVDWPHFVVVIGIFQTFPFFLLLFNRICSGKYSGVEPILKRRLMTLGASGAVAVIGIYETFLLRVDRPEIALSTIVFWGLGVAMVCDRLVSTQRS